MQSAVCSQAVGAGSSGARARLLPFLQRPRAQQRPRAKQLGRDDRSSAVGAGFDELREHQQAAEQAAPEGAADARRIGPPAGHLRGRALGLRPASSALPLRPNERSQEGGGPQRRLVAQVLPASKVFRVVVTSFYVIKFHLQS